ncbi:MAG: hypothetical protein WAK17_00865 [Candidatus Nitrosopolaris sp.]
MAWFHPSFLAAYGMYDKDGFFCDSDITPGLKNNTDGSLDIYLLRILNQQNSKTGFLLQMGPFSLLLRMYVPQDIVIKGQYQLPAVEKVVTNK